jgi:hypothetical protein
MSGRGANVTVTIGAAFTGSFRTVPREAARGRLRVIEGGQPTAGAG